MQAPSPSHTRGGRCAFRLFRCFDDYLALSGVCVAVGCADRFNFVVILGVFLRTGVGIAGFCRAVKVFEVHTVGAAIKPILRRTVDCLPEGRSNSRMCRYKKKIPRKSFYSSSRYSFFCISPLPHPINSVIILVLNYILIEW